MKSFRLYNSKEEKNNIKSILINNRYNKQPILIKDKNKQLISTIISKNKVSINIERIKNKYGFLTNSLSQKIAYNKIQNLKNKYLKNNNNFNSKLDFNTINTIDKFSINNNKNNNIKKLNKESVNNIIEKKKNLFRNSSLQFVKENNIIFNNFYNTFRNKIRNNDNRNNENRNNFNNILNDKKMKYNTIKEEKKTIINNKPKLSNKFKYLKNTRDEYMNVNKKLKDLLKNDAFNKKNKKGFNAIFPISKKINMLYEVKKDIKNLSKKSFDDVLISPKNTASFFSSSQSSDIHGINSDRKSNIFQELFEENENSDVINNENEIIKPNLIKSLPKPKLNVPNYVNFCNI